MVLFFNLLSAQASSLKCSQLFTQETHELPGFELDASYGNASQLDARLKEAGLFTKSTIFKLDQSMLCGPTCAYNVLEKFRVQNGEKLFPESESQEIIENVKNPFSLYKKSTQEVVNTGVSSDDLALNIAMMGKKQGLNIEIKLKTIMANKNIFFEKGISLNDLKSSVLPNEAVVVLVGFYRAENLQNLDLSNRTGGHFMVVAGYNRLNPQEMIFHDPERPLQYRRLNLAPVKPRNFQNMTYEILLDQNFLFPSIALTEDIIVIKNKK